MAKEKTPWYRMDNASFMYSALQSDEYSAIYRFSAVMDAPVDPEKLQRAVDRVMPRFPGLAVCIKRGFFWHYFEPNKNPGPFVKKDIAEPCMPVRFNEDNGWLIRFYYYQSRISIEVFHALADGLGALIFFRNLLAQYVRECGFEVPIGEGVFDLDEKPKPEEWEDAYSRYAGGKAKSQKLLSNSYLNKGEGEPFYTFNVTMGFIEVDEIKRRAKELGVSITEYMCAVLMTVLIAKQRSERPITERRVALSVPVNLRAYFPTSTLRNFIMAVQPYVDPALGDYSLVEIAKIVHHFMHIYAIPQELRAAFTSNVRLQKNKALLLIPSFLKDPIMAMSYRIRGLRPYSAIMTNPGVFKLPEAVAEHVVHIEAIQGQATVPRAHVASLSYKNTMVVTISGTHKDSYVEREFFRYLVRDGIHVRIESNRNRQGTGDVREES